MARRGRGRPAVVSRPRPVRPAPVTLPVTLPVTFGSRHAGRDAGRLAAWVGTPVRTAVRTTVRTTVRTLGPHPCTYGCTHHRTHHSMPAYPGTHLAARPPAAHRHRMRTQGVYHGPARSRAVPTSAGPGRHRRSVNQEAAPGISGGCGSPPLTAAIPMSPGTSPGDLAGVAPRHLPMSSAHFPQRDRLERPSAARLRDRHAQRQFGPRLAGSPGRCRGSARRFRAEPDAGPNPGVGGAPIRGNADRQVAGSGRARLRFRPGPDGACAARSPACRRHVSTASPRGDTYTGDAAAAGAKAQAGGAFRGAQRSSRGVSCKSVEGVCVGGRGRWGRAVGRRCWVGWWVDGLRRGWVAWCGGGLGAGSAAMAPTHHTSLASRERAPHGRGGRR
jgi:hypothetical protein